jgi:uncharacterized repeat protein (TIGR04138 family)
MPRKPKKSIEQVVDDLGHYPIDAFIFVQECIGAASEQVHGPMSPEEKAISQWMSEKDVDLDGLRSLCDAGQLPPDIVEALSKIGGAGEMNRHVTGQQLCHAIRHVALERWGLMARTVLERWSITTTEDIGAIIFALVDSDWLQKQPTDSIHDFDNVFSFDEAFDQAYRIEES